MSVTLSASEHIKRFLSFSTAEYILIGTILATLALLSVGMVMFNDYFVSSFLDQLQHQPGGFKDKYLLIFQLVNDNQYVADASVIVFWMLVGLGIYLIFCVLVIFERSFFRNFRLFLFIKNGKSLAIKEALVHLFVRAVSSAGLLVGAIYFMKYLYPYLFVSLNVNPFSPKTVLWNVLTITVITIVIVHATIVLLRGAFLRERLYGSYESS